MFGFGNKGNKRRVRNDTFGPSRLRNAAIAGVGMLAWRWWRNRQETSRTNRESNFAGTGSSFAESNKPAAGVY
jgi:hypothetical protein